MAVSRGRMALEDRAKQFMPFDALKGLREALREKERILEERRLLSEDQEEELDRTLHALRPGEEAEIEYYQGETRMRLTGRVRRVDSSRGILQIEDLEIPLKELQVLKRKEEFLSP